MGGPGIVVGIFGVAGLLLWAVDGGGIPGFGGVDDGRAALEAVGTWRTLRLKSYWGSWVRWG